MKKFAENRQKEGTRGNMVSIGALSVGKYIQGADKDGLSLKQRRAVEDAKERINLKYDGEEDLW